MKKIRTVLFANAIFSISSGLMGVIIPNKIGDFFSFENPILYNILGFGLLSFGLFVAYIAFKKIDNVKEIRMISYADFGWVLGSLILIIINPVNFSYSAIAAISAISLVVLTFGLFQLKYNR